MIDLTRERRGQRGSVQDGQVRVRDDEGFVLRRRRLKRMGLVPVGTRKVRVCDDSTDGV